MRENRCTPRNAKIDTHRPNTRRRKSAQRFPGNPRSAFAMCCTFDSPCTERNMRPIRPAAFYLECGAERQRSRRDGSIVLRQTRAAHQSGEPRIAAQRHESFMIEQHGHAAITSLECHFQRDKSMILFTKSCVDSSNVLPGSAVPLGFPDDITKNFSGLFDSAVLRVYKSEHALVDGRFRRGLHGLLKLFNGLLIFFIVLYSQTQKVVALVEDHIKY